MYSNNSKHKRKRNRYMTGEDIDMFHDKEYERKRKNDVPICDKHINGA